jgi:excisionase family DNA binding protein
MEILTTKEVCAILKTNRLTLYRLVKSDDLPAFRMGRAWKFERTALEGWIKKRMEESKKAIKQ